MVWLYAGCWPAAVCLISCLADAVQRNLQSTCQHVLIKLGLSPQGNACSFVTTTHCNIASIKAAQSSLLQPMSTLSPMRHASNLVPKVVSATANACRAVVTQGS